MSSKSKKEKSCGGVIVEGGKVLMVLQTNGNFAFPKGHMEEGETEIETAMREIAEETGVETELDQKKRAEVNYYIKDLNIDKHVVIFVGKPVGSIEVHPQEGEIEMVEWVEIPEVEGKLTYPEWKEVWTEIRKMIEE